MTTCDRTATAQRIGVFEFLFGLDSFGARTALTDAALAHLETFGLGNRAQRPAGSHAYGMQRRLERAGAATTRRALLDEPAAGQEVSETDALHQ